MKEHHYTITNQWTGNLGKGTKNYRSYKRDHIIKAPEKLIDIPGSSDPSFRGDPQRYNPEELFLASLSTCHMLWYLHLCAVNKIIVLDYQDEAKGTMIESEDGSGRFKAVTLFPVVKIQDAGKVDLAESLHHEANKMCFIANSCNFPILHQSEVQVQ